MKGFNPENITEQKRKNPSEGLEKYGAVIGVDRMNKDAHIVQFHFEKGVKKEVS